MKFTITKIARLALCLTQQQLASKTGINIRQIQKIESGEIKLENLTALNYMRLCNVLGLDPQKAIKIN